MPAKTKRKSKSKKRRGRARSSKAVRLIDLLRRFGMAAFVVVFSAWIGAWLWFSGAVHETGDYIVTTYYTMTAEYGYAVDDILVEGRHYTDPDVLRALLDTERGDPILAFDPEPVQDALEEVSWIRSARVERRLPDTVYVHLEERKPLALWKAGETIRLIDTFGEVITAADIREFSDLVIVTGDDAPERAIYLIELLEAEPALQGHVEAASRIGDRRWDLQMKNGMVVKLPEEDIGLALRRLAAAQEESEILKKNLLSIDLRHPDRMIVRTAPGAVKQYKAGFLVNKEI